jgi:hypothetical protein
MSVSSSGMVFKHKKECTAPLAHIKQNPLKKKVKLSL